MNPIIDFINANRDRYLAELKTANLDSLILGCTHYPMLAPLLRTAMGTNVRLVDSGAEAAHATAELLAARALLAPAGAPEPTLLGSGDAVAQALVVVLDQCKNDLSRANIMAQAANLKGVSLSMLLPGITLNTSPTDYRPIKDGYMLEFRDNQFNVISELLRGS